MDTNLNHSTAEFCNPTNITASNGSAHVAIKCQESPDHTQWPNYDIGRYIYFYGLSILLPLGMLCNALCFAVFLSSRSLRRTTTGHYLTALAVADTVYLFGELARWLNSYDRHGQIFGLEFMDTMLFWCHTTFFLRYAGQLVSAWITVVISVERFITVAYPLKVSRISTTKTAKLIILLIYILCIAFGSYPYWTLTLLKSDHRNTTYCGQKNKTVYEAWTMGVLRTGSLFLPSAIIFTFTFCIICHLKRAQKKKEELESRKKLNGKGTKKSIDFQLTVMLISVAIAFLVLRLPYTISFYLYNLKRDIWGENLDPWFVYKLFVANKFCELIAVANYASNFFLYCLCGSSFRMHLKRLMKVKKIRRTFSLSSRTFSSKMSFPLRSSARHLERLESELQGNKLNVSL